MNFSESGLWYAISGQQLEDLQRERCAGNARTSIRRQKILGANWVHRVVIGDMSSCCLAVDTHGSTSGWRKVVPLHYLAHNKIGDFFDQSDLT